MKKTLLRDCLMKCAAKEKEKVQTMGVVLILHEGANSLVIATVNEPAYIDQNGATILFPDTSEFQVKPDAHILTLLIRASLIYCLCAFGGHFSSVKHLLLFIVFGSFMEWYGTVHLDMAVREKKEHIPTAKATDAMYLPAPLIQLHIVK